MTSPRVEEFVRRVRQMAELMPEGKTLRIEQADMRGAWPLPWHFRQLPGYRWTGKGQSFDDMLEADIVIAAPEVLAYVPESIRVPPASVPAAAAAETPEKAAEAAPEAEKVSEAEKETAAEVKPEVKAEQRWFVETLTPNTEPRQLSIWTRKDLWDRWLAQNFPKDTPVQR